MVGPTTLTGQDVFLLEPPPPLVSNVPPTKNNMTGWKIHHD